MVLEGAASQWMISSTGEAANTTMRISVPGDATTDGMNYSPPRDFMANRVISGPGEAILPCQTAWPDEDVKPDMISALGESTDHDLNSLPEGQSTPHMNPTHESSFSSEPGFISPVEIELKFSSDRDSTDSLIDTASSTSTNGLSVVSQPTVSHADSTPTDDLTPLGSPERNETSAYRNNIDALLSPWPKVILKSIDSAMNREKTRSILASTRLLSFDDEGSISESEMNCKSSVSHQEKSFLPKGESSLPVADIDSSQGQTPMLDEPVKKKRGRPQKMRPIPERQEAPAVPEVPSKRILLEKNPSECGLCPHCSQG
jgi:hypothetical protein